MAFYPSLAQVVADLCQRAGLSASEIDVSLIGSIEIKGYVLTGQCDAKTALQNILAAHFVDCVESDFKLKFVPRGSSTPALTIPENDLGLKEDKVALVQQMPQQQDLPKEINVLFIDPNIDWQQNKQQKMRSSRAVVTKQTTTMQLPLVLTPDEGRAIAEKALYLAYLEGQPFNINLWKALYMVLDPTDIVDFEYKGNTFRMRAQTEAVGCNYVTQLTGVSEYSGAYLANPVGGIAEGVPPNVPDAPAPSDLFIFDIPYLTDSDAVADRSSSGIYFGGSNYQNTWAGLILYRSSDDANFDSVSSSAARMVYGQCNTVLGDPFNLWVWDDTNTVVVTMVNGSLASASDFDVLNGANAIMIGNECVQYAVASELGPGVFELSHLLRGRRNTEPFAYGHGTNEFAVDPTTGLQRLPLSLSTIGLVRYYRGVTVGEDIADVTSQILVLNAVDLLPAQVVHIKGTRGGSVLDLTVNWIRRTRYAGDWLNDTGNVPLNEDREAYEIDILNITDDVVRTIVWTPGMYDANNTPIAIYTEAEQIADFGSPQSSVTVIVYQLSAQVGRGFGAEKTI